MDLEIVYPKIYSTFESLQSQARSSEEHKRRFIVFPLFHTPTALNRVLHLLNADIKSTFTLELRDRPKSFIIESAKYNIFLLNSQISFAYSN